MLLFLQSLILVFFESNSRVAFLLSVICYVFVWIGFWTDIWLTDAILSLFCWGAFEFARDSCVQNAICGFWRHLSQYVLDAYTLKVRIWLPFLAVGQINASSTDDGLNFYDSGHRFEHSQLLLVLLRSLPYASRSLQSRALQVIFSCLLCFKCELILCTSRTWDNILSGIWYYR